jgi:hypothetical protein
MKFAHVACWLTNLTREKSGRKLLLICLFVCGAIIISDFAIETFTPTTVSLNDEISFFDLLWRAAVGQRVGIDYHDPLGFGPYLVGAQLLHWLGPHYYIMRLSIALFSVLISVFGCLVARRALVHRVDIALLFCVTLAFQLSAPTAYPDSAQFGLMEFYNRLSASALAVLFLQTFSDRSFTTVSGDRWEIGASIVLNAILLDLLFLTKISAFLLGLFVISVGCASKNRFIPKCLSLCATVVVFGTMAAVEFRTTGFDLTAVIREYELAARARSAYSVYDVVRGLFNWPLIASVGLLAVFGLPQRRDQREQQPSGLTNTSIIIGCYIVCQFVLNMTNAGPATMWLAPAAVGSLAICVGTKATAWQVNPSENAWKKFNLCNLGDVSLREASPFLVYIIVLFRQVLGSVLGVGFGLAIAAGIMTPYVITAEKNMSFWVYPAGQYEKSLNDAVNAITSLKLDHEIIANLDYSNPFPVLFLAPPPKGNYVWFGWGYNIPNGAVLNWQDVIGDACIVTTPAEPFDPGVTLRLVEVVRSKLLSDFEVVFQDKSWSIYQRVHDCGIVSRR